LLIIQYIKEHYGERPKTGGFGIRIMRPSGATSRRVSVS